jgi:hypothetical protein
MISILIGVAAFIDGLGVGIFLRDRFGPKVVHEVVAAVKADAEQIEQIVVEAYEEDKEEAKAKPTLPIAEADSKITFVSRK